MRALLYASNNCPWVDKGGGVETQVIYQNYGDDRVWYDYGSVGISRHRFQPGAAFKSEEKPDIHGAASEIFKCLTGTFAIFTVDEHGEKHEHVLHEDDILQIGAGVPHWGYSLLDASVSMMETTVIGHRQYNGSTPWRSDAVLD